MNDLNCDLAALAFFVAALLSTVLIVLLRPLLQRYALARPNARSSHFIPTPQGAGIAVVAATLFVAATWFAMSGFPVPLALFSATLFMGLIGFADDVRPIPVLPRLFLQALAVAAIVFSAPSDFRIIPALPLEFERALLLLTGLWFVNLVNFMDGLDLMTVAEVVPITAAMILLGCTGNFPALSTIIATALCGATLGFAPLNRPVAKVFLGDVGSLPIGLLLGWCLLQLAWHQHLIAAILLPLYYLVDTTVTLARRMARRDSFWLAHRTHFYQQATDNGFSVSQVITLVFALNAILAILAILSVSTKSMVMQLPLLLLGLLLTSLTLFRFSRKRLLRIPRE